MEPPAPMDTAMLPRLEKISDRMEKIERLGWAAGIAAGFYGLRIGVRTNRPEILVKLEERLPPHRAPLDTPFVDYLYSLRVAGAPNARTSYRLYFGSKKIGRTTGLDVVLDELESHLQWQVAVNARTRVLVHAGVVAWQGLAIVLPGYSFAGKSTLVAELLKAGATYYSDEYAVLDPAGLVHPYARRLSLRQQGGRLPSLRCTAADFGVAAGAGPIPVGLIAFASYRPGERWRPRRLGPGPAAWELMNCTITARRQPEASMNALHRVAASAACYKGVRGEAADTAQWLLQEVEHATVGQLNEPRTGEPVLAA